MEEENESEGLDWLSLPEGCIGNIISLTSPRDACRLSVVSSAFRSAADSDAVWERFLPSDYPAIISRSCSPSSPLGDISSKKELYFRLCDSPLLIDDGTKSFSLERCSGKKCYMLGPESLFIAWVDAPQYWTWISLPESRFREVAELRAVRWLEIRGMMDTGMLSIGTNYAAYLVFKLAEDTYGFERRSVEVSAGVGSQTEVRSVLLDPNGGGEWRFDEGNQAYPGEEEVVLDEGNQVYLGEEDGVPHEGNQAYPGEEEGVPDEVNQAYLSVRGDGWQEVELGEFFIDGDDCEELEMSLLEVKGGHWKLGLIIEGIEIRPKKGLIINSGPSKRQTHRSEDLAVNLSLSSVTINTREERERERERMEGENERERLDWSSLPEGCIANIISVTSPRDACRLSLVSSAFRSAADSDSVWERFLPSDYPAILSRSCSPLSPWGDFSSKKELYFRLCDSPLLIDGGTKSFSLERCSGKKCYMLAPRSLSIAWGDTPAYWRRISLPESRFREVAELLFVCWLEIRGKMDTGLLSPATNYAAYIIFKFKERTYGFGRQPVEVSAGVGSQNEVRSVVLDPNGGRWRCRPGEEEGVPDEGNQAYLSVRGDGWREVELGKFFIEGDNCKELEMSLLEVKGLLWKSGLIIQGIEIRPKKGE
ncbi:uncharacterized protein LOC131167477 [Malania oleifera]|uniref:uncharacterized protein LOC131167477 n=1 Tax=Malania oleifera TaxID=397392 RepID=UPI0025AE2063|nr:uncharacterized protein LOC131167477 [Malania oleifera]